ncbi:protein tilB [Sitophilus oryzae]|uniref:Protein tilB n=1 Tax=Sitophilus oryzae TaxID=7048 RepID=A0A6J2X8M0_SITOR|nr:protein tilB [Sitophilus oryzae]
MVLITEELVRKKSEHNEGIIGTLEELSLHQEDIEKIEHLNNWCRELEILYLQANQISKIENLNKLKKLQYLNLAINNVEKIENLEGCESLEKLDLTLNFIGDLESVKKLKKNIFLKHLYLTGNPCCDFEGYREYVIAQLPQLESLDVKEISRSERIKAQQNLIENEKIILKAQEEYKKFRENQKNRMLQKDNSHLTDDEFWKSVSENSPETRLEISKRQRKRDSNVDTASNMKVKRTVRLFAKDGRPLNVNEAKLGFKFTDDSPDKFVLDVALYKFLDTNLIDIDLQPIYVKLTIKGKVFQIVFPEEIQIENSTALRSQTTGHLVLSLPKLNFKKLVKQEKNTEKAKLNDKKDKDKQAQEEKKTSETFLEVTGPKEDMDYTKIIENNKNRISYNEYPDIPVLEYGF